MLARVLAVARCLSVCYNSVFHRNGSTSRADFCMEASFDLFYQEILASQNKSASFWIIVLNSGLQ